ncbi:hypothetical protein E4U13_003258 [Claviceps humidiphila]|uniref:Uncharacterized protein n=1 Tax=Claviceps humidiphila TaxID=1294629 RepID=A0A9P7Q071_9HYPO|nr:hypothetical protein E4U13_003258 [Claviceps humidiphila]
MQVLHYFICLINVRFEGVTPEAIGVVLDNGRIILCLLSIEAVGQEGLFEEVAKFVGVIEVVDFAFESVLNGGWIILCFLSIEAVGQEDLFEEVGKVIGVIEVIGIESSVSSHRLPSTR